mmetsp:Transcript_40417/g.86053  ORF Transcript_40417/g.86053 Transcript_40417/m.86053 type:complete len:388 (+) Transcript_40417:118-1281(+)
MADALLDDLDDLSDVEPEEEPSYEDGGAEDDASRGVYDDGADDGAAAAGDGTNLGASSSSADGDGDTSRAASSRATRRRPRLLDDASLESHLSAIRAAQESDDRKPGAADGGDSFNSKEEDERQHALILASNRHLVSLGHEIHRAHLELCRRYQPKFPELEELLTDPLKYRAAIGIIQNEMDLTKSNERLNEILTSNQIITISVAGSTTSGRPLTDEELGGVNETCRYLDELHSAQAELGAFVESRMERWAPSVCALVGPSLAARLLASTGGLAELTRIPACNLQLIGKSRSTSASRGGMATQSRVQHAGILTECPLVRAVPNYLKTRAVKAVAGKLALAARTDHVNVESGRARTADVGRRFREELRTKFGKWEEPDKAQVVKALPK